MKKEHIDGHVCRYAETANMGRAHDAQWHAWTVEPLPYFSETSGRTENEALRKLERSVLREFKHIAKVIGYEVHDG